MGRAARVSVAVARRARVHARARAGAQVLGDLEAD
jgi:hypothetical protein